MKSIWIKRVKTIVFFALILVISFIPSAKALLIRGLMEVGLFSAKIESVKTPPQDLSILQFKDAQGKIINLADLKGKIIFLNFWATWCPPCLAEMPSINKLHQQFKNDSDIVFLMIDADGDFQKSQAYMDKRDYQMPIYTFYSDLPQNIFDRSLPTTLIFDKQGRIAHKNIGAANYASKKIINFIKELKALEK